MELRKIDCPYCSEHDETLVQRSECEICEGTGNFYFSTRSIEKMEEENESGN